MARTRTAEYFPHDSNAKDDPKIMIMLSQLGLEAYGIYWILVEYLREQPGYRAPLALLDPLSRRYGSSKEKFDLIITKFSLFEHDDNEFWSPSLMRRMTPLDEKREYMTALIAKRWEKERVKDTTRNTHVLPANNKTDTHVNTHVDTHVIQSRVEESRVEESRVDKSRVDKSRVDKSRKEKSKEEKEALFSLPFVSSEFLPVWKRWVEYKKKLGKPYKTVEGMQTKYNDLLKLSENNPEIAMKIVEQSIGNEWEGIFPLKDNLDTSPGKSPVEKIKDQINKAMK